MLMLMMALSFVVSEPNTKNEAKERVDSGMLLVGYRLPKPPPPFPYSLKPQWQVAVLAFRNGASPIQSAESNLEQWRNLIQTVKIEDITPRKAMPITAKSHDYYYSGSYTDQAMCTHAPWYLSVQQHWPDYFGSEAVLFYEVVRTPTMQKPYYEAFVCCMPNIRCKAKTIELLQEQLLQQYSSYLQILLERGIPEPDHQAEVIFGESWIAKLPIRYEMKADTREKLKKEQIDYNQIPSMHFGY